MFKTIISIPVPRIDPGVSPKNDWPFITAIANFVGNFQTLGIVLMVAAIIAAAAVWAYGSFSSNSTLESRGKLGTIIALIASVVIGSAGGLVTFFSNQSLGV